MYQSENIWHNATMMKAEEARSYDDLLQPKFKGKIGILDPRSAGAGTATWAFFLKIKGEEWLRKLAAQDMFLSRDQRQLADSLAKGKVAITIGLTYYTFVTILEGRPAGQTVARHERRHLHQLRQQRDFDRQELAAS